MFYRCSALSSVDVGTWDISKVETMMSMFEECSSLTSLDLSSWNEAETSCDIPNMFCGCTSLRELKIGNWRPVTERRPLGRYLMGSLFENTKLVNIDLSNWVVSPTYEYNGRTYYNYLYAYGMFKGCDQLETVKLWSGEWAPVEVTEMFYGCEKLKEVDLSNVNTRILGYTGSTICLDKGVGDLFTGCTSIEKIVCPKELGINGDTYDVPLPYEFMYDYDNTNNKFIHDKLPQNAAVSITLYRDFT
jgi:surface protein